MIYSWPVRSPGNTLDLESEMGESCGTEPLTCRTWCTLQVDSVRT